MLPNRCFPHFRSLSCSGARSLSLFLSLSLSQNEGRCCQTDTLLPLSLTHTLCSILSRVRSRSLSLARARSRSLSRLLARALSLSVFLSQMFTLSFTRFALSLCSLIRFPSLSHKRACSLTLSLSPRALCAHTLCVSYTNRSSVHSFCSRTSPRCRGT